MNANAATKCTELHLKRLCGISLSYCYLYLSGSARGGSGIAVYPKKIRQNTQKYPKFIQIYPKLMEALYRLISFASLQVFAFERQNMTFTANVLLTCILNCDAGPSYD